MAERLHAAPDSAAPVHPLPRHVQLRLVNRPHKKKDTLPGDPKVRTAAEAEVLLAREIRAAKTAKLLAA